MHVFQVGNQALAPSGRPRLGRPLRVEIIEVIGREVHRELYRVKDETGDVWLACSVDLVPEPKCLPLL